MRVVGHEPLSEIAEGPERQSTINRHQIFLIKSPSLLKTSRLRIILLQQDTNTTDYSHSIWKQNITYICSQSSLQYFQFLTQQHTLFPSQHKVSLQYFQFITPYPTIVPPQHKIAYTISTSSHNSMTTHRLLVPPSWKRRTTTLPTLWATTRPVTGSLYLYLHNSILYFHPNTK